MGIVAEVCPRLNRWTQLHCDGLGMKGDVSEILHHAVARLYMPNKCGPSGSATSLRRRLSVRSGSVGDVTQDAVPPAPLGAQPLPRSVSG